jgi:hypothetical protein
MGFARGAPFGIWNLVFEISTALPWSGGIDHDQEVGVLLAEIAKFVCNA